MYSFTTSPTIDSDKFNKCKDLIREINEEREKYESIEKENANLNTLGLLMRQKFAKLELFKISLKIFDDVFDIYNLYDIQVLPEDLTRQGQNCKLYLIEVYPSNVLPDSIVNKKWIVHISIKNSRKRYHKTCWIKGNSKNPPYRIVVPFESSEEDATVETCILHPMGQNCWPILKSVTIEANLSYHFKPFSEKAKNRSGNRRTIIDNFSKMYSSDNAFHDSTHIASPIVHYQLRCLCDERDLLQTLLRNCYHRVDCRHLLAVVGSSPEMLNFQLSTSESDIVIKYDKDSKILNITAPPVEMNFIKKYLFQELPRSGELHIDKMWFHRLQTLKEKFAIEVTENVIQISKVRDLVNNFRQLCFRLPL